MYKPTPSEQAEIARLTTKQERLQQRVSRLKNRRDITNDLIDAFPMGQVGGSGRGTARLNRRREAAFDAYLDRLPKIGALEDRIGVIERKIMALKTGQHAADRAQKEARREARAAREIVRAELRRQAAARRPAADKEGLAQYQQAARSAYDTLEAAAQRHSKPIVRGWPDPVYLDSASAAGVYHAACSVIVGEHMRGNFATRDLIAAEIERERGRAQKWRDNDGPRISPDALRYTQGIFDTIPAALQLVAALPLPATTKDVPEGWRIALAEAARPV